MAGSQIGSILLKNQWISQKRLSQALAIQKKYLEENYQWKLLGEILVALGYLDSSHIVSALHEQSIYREATFFEAQQHRSNYSKFKRLSDIFGAIVGLIFTTIVFPWIALAIFLDDGSPILFSQYRVGIRGKQFKIWKFRTMVPDAERDKFKVIHTQDYKFFNNRQDPRVTRVGKFLRETYLDELPQFWNVLKGEMSLVGTRPPTLDEVKAYSSSDWYRLSIKPGMTGLWQVSSNKTSANFDEVLEKDLYYIKSWRRRNDIQIIIQTILRLVLRFQNLEKRVTSENQYLRKVQILNIKLDNLSKAEILMQLNQGIVLTPNVDHIMKLQRDPEFLNIYNSADYKICDSQILLLASKFLGTPIKEKVSGSDLFPAFCEYHKNNENIRIFLLGGDSESVEIARRKINQKIGREIIVGTYSPPFGFENNKNLSLEIVARIAQCNPSVLAVGVGAPKQEKWISQYKDNLLNVKIFLAIGATIQFEAGTLKRSPQWVSKAGLEWLYRLLMEPKRLWKRYFIDDIPFFGLLILQKLGLYQNSVAKRNKLRVKSRKSNSSD